VAATGAGAGGTSVEGRAAATIETDASDGTADLRWSVVHAKRIKASAPSAAAATAIATQCRREGGRADGAS